MARARPNPIGLPASSTWVVRLGEGEHTHLFDPKRGHTLCRSGVGRSKEPQRIYRTEANFVTCYRCAKLGQMNEDAGRQAWESP